VLRHQAVRNAGMMLSWYLQQPLMLAAHLHASACGQQPSAVQHLKGYITVFLNSVMGHFVGLEISSAAGLVAAVAQQQVGS
jgi:hypothetical protein